MFLHTAFVVNLTWLSHQSQFKHDLQYPWCEVACKNQKGAIPIRSNYGFDFDSKSSRVMATTLPACMSTWSTTFALSTLEREGRKRERERERRSSSCRACPNLKKEEARNREGATEREKTDMILVTHETSPDCQCRFNFTLILCRRQAYDLLKDIHTWLVEDPLHEDWKNNFLFFFCFKLSHFRSRSRYKRDGILLSARNGSRALSSHHTLGDLEITRLDRSRVTNENECRRWRFFRLLRLSWIFSRSILPEYELDIREYHTVRIQRRIDYVRYLPPAPVRVWTSLVGRG